MIHAANEWGRELRSTPPRPGTVTHLTLHWVGSSNYNRTPDQIPAGIKQIEQGQFRADGNLSAISYNFLVDKYGGIWEGRGYNYRNAANGKNANNTTSMSVCVLVGAMTPHRPPKPLQHSNGCGRQRQASSADRSSSNAI
jgi:hypothetical protein